jgi:hypothetical protein
LLKKSKNGGQQVGHFEGAEFTLENNTLGTAEGQYPSAPDAI